MICRRTQRGERSAAFKPCQLSGQFSQDKLARSCFLKQRHPVDVNWLSWEIFNTAFPAKVSVVTRGNKIESLYPDQSKTWIQMPPSQGGQLVWNLEYKKRMLSVRFPGYWRNHVGVSAKHGWRKGFRITKLLFGRLVSGRIAVEVSCSVPRGTIEMVS